MGLAMNKFSKSEQEDDLIQSAVVRKLEIIGESSHQVSQDFKDEYSEVL